MIRMTIDSAGYDALVILASDHGAKASGRRVPVDGILAEKGLLSYKTDKDDAP